MNELIYLIIALAGFFVYALFMILKFLLHVKITKQIILLHILASLTALFSFLILFFSTQHLSFWSLISSVLIIVGVYFIYSSSKNLR